MKKGTISIARLNDGGGNNRVRIMIRRRGDAPAQRMLLGVSFEAFARALLGESEVDIDIERDVDG